MPRSSIKDQAAKRKAEAEAKKATKTTPASKTRATKTTATKATKPAATKLPLTNGNGNGAKLATNTSQALVPGLTTINPNEIEGMLPQFDAAIINAGQRQGLECRISPGRCNRGEGKKNICLRLLCPKIFCQQHRCQI